MLPDNQYNISTRLSIGILPNYV